MFSEPNLVAVVTSFTADCWVLAGTSRCGFGLQLRRFV